MSGMRTARPASRCAMAAGGGCCTRVRESCLQTWRKRCCGWRRTTWSRSGRARALVGATGRMFGALWAAARWSSLERAGAG
eukprot:78-Chlamydomonas_euryale.AAC.1